MLTIAIDVCTRMVAGFHLALEAPSSVSVGLCLLHAVYDKTAWLGERGIDLSWPVAGLPGILHSDNGAEFHSRALTGACREYGIKIQYRPPATPRFGGHVERLIGTMMGAVHILPGTTFSNIKLKENYDAQGRAIFTLRELEAWIAIEIAGKYHHRIHSALLRPPIARWRDLQGEVVLEFRPATRPHGVLDELFAGETKAIAQGWNSPGENPRYWSDARAARCQGVALKVTIKYDPRDMSLIFVRQPDGHFIEARYRNLAFPHASRWWEPEARQRPFEEARQARPCL